MSDKADDSASVYRTEKVQAALDLLLKKWPELEPLQDRLRARLSIAAQDISLRLVASEDLDVFLEELWDRSHLWLVAESKKLSPIERVQAITRLLKISPEEFEDFCWALETVQTHSPLFIGGNEGFLDRVQDFSWKIEHGEPIQDLHGTIENKRDIEAASLLVKQSRFLKLPEIEGHFLKALGVLLGSEGFGAESSDDSEPLKGVARTLCNSLAENMRPEDMEVYGDADSIGISRIRLHKVSEFISALYVLNQSDFPDMAFGAIEEDDALKGWISFNEEYQHTPASWFLAGKIAEDTAEFTTELAQGYLKVEKRIEEVTNQLDYELSDTIKTRFKLDDFGKSALPKLGEKGIVRSKWSIDMEKSILRHEDFPDDSIRLPVSTRESLWVIFNRIPEGKVQASFDEREILIEARRRVEHLGKNRKEEMPKKLKGWAFTKDMLFLWGNDKLLGSTNSRPNQEERSGKYLKGRLRIDLTVPFPKR
ncbi:MAG: hypothetical protein JST16_05345 [Bdellovibrionales bacterium]|nr:hypothetical protein [Bdellovibrionales bacterium]